MNTTVTKEFTFDCAHMLSNHKGLCANVHGHTYKLQVTLEASVLNADEGHTEEGMLIDFSLLKEIVKEHVVDVFDHAFITWVHGNDTELNVAAVLEEQGLKVVKVPYRTTCENMVASIFQKLSQLYWGSHVELKGIKLWETPTSYAEVTL